MIKNSPECKEFQTKKPCFACENCDKCIKDVSAAFAKMVTNDLFGRHSYDKRS